MNLKKIVTVSGIAAGLVCIAGYTQASDSSQDITHSSALLMAQGSSGSGTSNSGLYGGTPDLNSPGGTRDIGKVSGGSMDTGKDRQGSGSGMESGSSGPAVGKSAGGSGSSGMSGSGDKGKSATGQPAAGGPQGEDKAGGSGPSGPQSSPPGGSPQFEGGKKGK